MGIKRDLTREVFGDLTAIADTGKRHNGSVVWRCECAYGHAVDVTQKRLVTRAQTCPLCEPPAAVDDYGLGIIWATASVIGDQMIVRNMDRHFAAEIQRQLGGTIFTLTHARNGTLLHCIKVPRRALNYAAACGLTGRSDQERIFPTVQKSFDFVRAYVQCHSSIDFVIKKRRGVEYPALRLRIYGALAVMAGINRVLSDQLGCGLKTPQAWHGMYTLYYQSSREVFDICSAIGDALPRSDAFSSRFDQVLQKSGYKYTKKCAPQP